MTGNGRAAKRWPSRAQIVGCAGMLISFPQRPNRLNKPMLRLSDGVAFSNFKFLIPGTIQGEITR